MAKLLRTKVGFQITRRWFKRVGILFLSSCFLVAGCYFILKSDFLTIKHINCSVKGKTSIADEKRWCEQAERLLLGKRIMWSNLTTVVVNLEHKFLPIGEVVVRKKLPQTVVVQIGERNPIAKVCQLGGLEFLVDKEGVVYAETQPDSRGLRTIALELGFELLLGQTVDAEVVSLILLEEPQASSIRFVGQQGIEIKTSEDLTILLSREKEFEGQIRALQTIVKKYKIEGKDLRQIDLRFDQPVVRY